MRTNRCPRTIRFASIRRITLTPHLGASTKEAQEKCGIEVAEVVAGYLLTGEVRNAVNLPYLDAKTYEQVKPYLTLGEKLGKLLAQLAPPQVDRLHITYGGKAKDLPNVDPITRAILQGFLSRADGEGPEQRECPQHRLDAGRDGGGKALQRAGHVQRMAARAGVQRSGQKLISAGGTFFGSPDNPRIVRVYSQPTEIVPFGVVLLLRNKDRPGIVGYLGTLLGEAQGEHRQHEPEPRHRRRSRADGFEPGQRAATGGFGEIRNDPDISDVDVVKL